MWTALGAGVDFIHAVAMAAWVVGFPLLFVQRWPHARLAYATYAVLFVVLSQTSMFLLHECFLTKVASWCWGHDPSHFASNDWFTERLARAIFGMAPSRHLIARLSEALVLATVAGVILSVVHVRRHASTRTRPGRHLREELENAESSCCRPAVLLNFPGKVRSRSERQRMDENRSEP
jgi:hypothetical protein